MPDNQGLGGWSAAMTGVALGTKFMNGIGKSSRLGKLDAVFVANPEGINRFFAGPGPPTCILMYSIVLYD